MIKSRPEQRGGEDGDGGRTGDALEGGGQRPVEGHREVHGHEAPGCGGEARHLGRGVDAKGRAQELDARGAGAEEAEEPGHGAGQAQKGAPAHEAEGRQAEEPV